jgi:hypothetical protein
VFGDYTHVLWRSLFKRLRCGEVTMAHYLVRLLEKNMLLLWDRNFLSCELVREVRQRGLICLLACRRT